MKNLFGNIIKLWSWICDCGDTHSDSEKKCSHCNMYNPDY